MSKKNEIQVNYTVTIIVSKSSFEVMCVDLLHCSLTISFYIKIDEQKKRRKIMRM